MLIRSVIALLLVASICGYAISAAANPFDVSDKNFMTPIVVAKVAVSLKKIAHYDRSHYGYRTPQVYKPPPERDFKPSYRYISPYRLPYYPQWGYRKYGPPY